MKYIPARTYRWGDFSFVLEYDYELTQQDINNCKELWCGTTEKVGVIEQAIDDYIYLKFSKSKLEQALWADARDFLFDDKHVFPFGSGMINLRELLGELRLPIHIDRLRRYIVEKEEEVNQGKDFESGTQMLLV